MADTNLHELVQTDVFFYHEVQHQLSVVNFPSIEQWDFTCDFKTACPMLATERRLTVKFLKALQDKAVSYAINIKRLDSREGLVRGDFDMDLLDAYGSS
ncbi:hypothetical protein AVEN_182986-1 [Araneus ventricosus]|uniref:Uncharacterized protein n=1 Tax=Araneus ventricosus TaxID=182803 RepID=A0A4Y2RQ98_ARAVE|nr:hypothetical protein AVEN_182986-1 [Araneus ventricosus]